LDARPVSVPTGLHVCLINLDRSPDRLAEFREINAHLSEDFTRFSAVDGQTLDLAVLQGAGLITSDILTTYSAGALGCAMSHIALWKRGLAGGEVLTVAEDDAVFHTRFREHAAEVMAKLPADWDIVLWGWNFDLFASIEMVPGVSPCLAQFEQIKTVAAVRQFQGQALQPHPLRLRWAFGTACYSVSPNGMRQIMDKCLPLRPLVIPFPEGLRAAPHMPYFRAVGIDVTLNAVYRDLNAFMCFPPLVVTRNDRSQSTISTTR
jgi:GR25 family glycosyltransferase involved in LPS biosynthesis